MLSPDSFSEALHSSLVYAKTLADITMCIEKRFELQVHFSCSGHILRLSSNLRVPRSTLTGISQRVDAKNPWGTVIHVKAAVPVHHREP